MACETKEGGVGVVNEGGSVDAEELVRRSEAVARVLEGDLTKCGISVGYMYGEREMYKKVEEVDSDDGTITANEDESYDKRIYKALMAAAVINDEYHRAACFAMQTEKGEPGEHEGMRIRVADRSVELGDTAAFRDEIQPKGVEAAFGDLARQETRVDAEVRAATEFTEDEFQWIQGGGDDAPEIDPMAVPAIARCVRALTDHLFPAVAAVTLRKYKLNLYKTGDFFAPHIDHPRDAAATIATLVVLLPTSFEKGALCFPPLPYDDVSDGDSSDDDSNEAALMKDDGAPLETLFCDTTRLQCCAFLNTVQHSVERVRAGCRVTITYTIDAVYENSPSAPPPSPVQPTPLEPSISEHAQYLQQQLTNSIHRRLANVFPPPTPIGVVLTGKYTSEAVLKHGPSCLTYPKDIALRDFLTNRLAVTDLRLISVALELTATLYSGMQGGDYDEYGTKVYMISLRKWDAIFHPDPTAPDRADPDLADPFPDDYIPFLAHPDMHGAVRIMHKRKSASEYTGNQAEPGSLRCIYFHTALLFTLPQLPADSLKRKRAPTPPPATSSSQ